MVENFYDVANKLDYLKIVGNPTKRELEEISQYLAGSEYVRYFFYDLDNPAWVRPLHALGLFNKVPPPLEDKNQPGYFSMPFWYEGEYLKRMADKFPDIVRDIALSLKTDNSRALRTMLETLLKVPVEITAEIVGEFKGWIETPFSNFMMLAHELGIIMEYLAKGGEVKASLATLAILLEPIQVKDRFDEEKLVAGTRHDFYWLNQALQINLPVLTKNNPIGVINVTEEQLIKAIQLEHDPRIDDKSKKLNSYWRLRINPKSGANYDNEIKNILVNTIITALNEACEQLPNEVRSILSRYIGSDYSILRRIAIYILKSRGQHFTDLVEKAYFSYKEKPIHAGQEEFDRFIETQFNIFSETIKKEILFDRTNPDPEFVEDILNNRPEAFGSGTREERKKTLIETWQLRELTPLASHLEGKEKELYDNLLNKYGKPALEAEDEPATVSWIGDKSPIEPDEFSKKSIIDVIRDLINFIPENNAPFGEPSREGLARILENDIQARPNDYANQAKLFIDSNIQIIYHTHFLRGLENVVKKQERFELDGVIAVCEFVVNHEDEKYQRSDYEGGLPAAKLAVAHLFEEIFRVKEPYISNELLERSGKIIVELLHQQEPFPDNEDAQGYDPATHSLNCVHGVALHSLVSYGLYCERKRKKDASDKGEPVMIPLVKEILTQNLDKMKNPSLAVHSIFGWYFPQFIYLDKAWALENRERIFPAETEMRKYWQAAWYAYIRFSDVYTNVFPELIAKYQKALEEFQTSEKSQRRAERVDEQMATHILKAYLLDMIKLDSEDDLLSLYYQKADDETRSHGNFWLSKVLESQQPSPESQIWKKVWSLWQWRIESATKSDDKNSFSKEIANFSRLLKHCPLNLGELNSVIERMIAFRLNGYEAGEIMDYLGKNSEAFPSLAVANLQKIILATQEFYILDNTKKSIEQILSSAMKIDENSKAKAIEIINVFGERGDYSWRRLLELANG